MNASGLATAGASIRLRFRPCVRLIASTTRLVTDLYCELVEEAAASRIVLAVHELMENTAKYSEDDDQPSIAVELLARGAQTRVRIETRNRSNPS